MVDAITGEGAAEGKTLPSRFLVGSDAYKLVRSTCEDHIKSFDEWKDVIVQTDHE
jgi:hypothetical protein